jgi:hypothetical protein
VAQVVEANLAQTRVFERRVEPLAHLLVAAKRGYDRVVTCWWRNAISVFAALTINVGGIAGCGGGDQGTTTGKSAYQVHPEKTAHQAQPKQVKESAPPEQAAPPQAKPQAVPWPGLAYAAEQEGWSSNESAAFVSEMKEAGLSANRAQGTLAAALVLEEHGYGHREAVEGAREAEIALGAG